MNYYRGMSEKLLKTLQKNQIFNTGTAFVKQLKLLTKNQNRG